MKILIYVENFIAGGVDTVLANKINAWPMEDEIILMCNITNDGLEKILKKRIARPYTLVLSDILIKSELIRKYMKRIPVLVSKVIMYFATYLIGICNAFLIFNKLKRASIDAIFIHNGGYPAADSARFVVMSAKMASIKHIFMVIHNFATPYQKLNKPFEYLLDRMVEKRCKMICVSQKCYESLTTLRKLKNPTYTIYNGLTPPIKNLQSSINKDILALKPTSYFLAIIAWFDDSKGYEDLFSALSILKEKFHYKNIKCLVFGKGADSHGDIWLGNLVKYYDVEDFVCLMGFKPDVIDYLEYVDILVVPSRQFEGFSMAALEAIFQGVPTIISSICGITEILTDQISTYVIPPYNPQELATAIHKLLTDQILRSRISEAAKEKICSTFDAKKMVLEYKQLLC